MDAGLLVAGSLAIALGFGHMAVGLRWVLPGLAERELPSTPVGPGSVSMSMLRITWHIVTVFAVGIGVILVALASDGTDDPRALALRGIGSIWIAATVMAGLVTPLDRASIKRSLRFPIPYLWLVIGILCWIAAR